MSESMLSISQFGRLIGDNNYSEKRKYVSMKSLAREVTYGWERIFLFETIVILVCNWMFARLPILLRRKEHIMSCLPEICRTCPRRYRCDHNPNSTAPIGGYSSSSYSSSSSSGADDSFFAARMSEREIEMRHAERNLHYDLHQGDPDE